MYGNTMPNTEKLAIRPVKDAATAIETIAQAILDGRLSVETTVEAQPTLKITNRIIIDPVPQIP
jgi:hypothetical protein